MTLRRLLSSVAGPVVDVILPQRCWTGDPDPDVALGLSTTARQKIARLAAQPYCHFCGLAIGPYESHDARNPCGRCGTREAGVDRIARVGPFVEPLVTLVHRLKFSRAWEVAPALAPFVYQAMLRLSESARVPVDLIVPVPLHWSRRARRGFNQAEEIAREVAALSGWKIANVLRRTRPTAEQALTDSRAQRIENLRGAFACLAKAPRFVAGKQVWLLDDVSTTGATLHAAAAALRKLPRDHRPASINGAVVCVVDHQAPPIPTATSST